MKVDVTGLSPLVLLRAMWEHTNPAGFFTMSGKPPPGFDDEIAKKQIENSKIDYCCGRCIKTDFGDFAKYDCGEVTKVELESSLYDRDSNVKLSDIVENLRRAQNTQNA